MRGEVLPRGFSPTRNRTYLRERPIFYCANAHFFIEVRYYSSHMGVVYSPEEVALGHVAKPGDHEALGRLLLSAAENSPVIRAGIVYGSSVYGIANRRSDVDYLAIYDDDAALDAFTLIRGVKRAAMDRGIYAKAEEHWEPEEPLVKPGQVDKQYLAHFAAVTQRSPGWVIGNPISYIDQTPLEKNDLLFSVRQYLSAKTAKFTKTACDLSPDHHDIQRALELPVAIARKVMLVMQPHCGVMAPTENKGAMITVSNRILNSPCISRMFPTKQAVDSQARLLFFDREYSAALDRAMEVDGHYRSIGRYEKWLNRHTREILDQAFILSRSWQKILDSVE